MCCVRVRTLFPLVSISNSILIYTEPTDAASSRSRDATVDDSTSTTDADDDLVFGEQPEQQQSGAVARSGPL